MPHHGTSIYCQPFDILIATLPYGALTHFRQKYPAFMLGKARIEAELALILTLKDLYVRQT